MTCLPYTHSQLNSVYYTTTQTTHSPPFIKSFILVPLMLITDTNHSNTRSHDTIPHVQVESDSWPCRVADATQALASLHSSDSAARAAIYVLFGLIIPSKPGPSHNPKVQCCKTLLSLDLRAKLITTLVMIAQGVCVPSGRVAMGLYTEKHGLLAIYEGMQRSMRDEQRQ